MSEQQTQNSVTQASLATKGSTLGDQDIPALLGRIASLLERMAPPQAEMTDLDSADAFVWHPSPPRLAPVFKVNRV